MPTAMKALRVIALTVLVLGETALAAYLSMVAWLLSVWMVEDSEAFQMTASDWLWTGVARFAEWFLVGAILGIVLSQANKYAGRRLLVRSVFWLALIGWLVGVGVIVASAAGAIEFVRTKPYM